jgi:hypothetical protein
MISDLLEELEPSKWLQIREAFENEYTLILDVGEYWVGVNVPNEVPVLGREGHYSYGKRS